MAHGIADDLGSNIILASDSKILIAPSMNPYMWGNKATQDNLKILKQRGIDLINPASGTMACGENGTGRLPEINEIYAFTKNYLLKEEKKSSIDLRNQLKVLNIHLNIFGKIKRTPLFLEEQVPVKVSMLTLICD